MSLTQPRGSLEQLGLPDLLASICAPQETGVLSLTRHGLTKSIYIQDGRIVFATSNDPDDRLGELLLCKGMLRIRDFEEASARLSPRKRLGAVLVEMGSLRAEELVRAVVEQVKDIVFGLFMWFDGEYHYERGDLPSREVITLKLSTPEVILGGILRIDGWSRVLRGLGGLETVFRASPGREKVLHQMQLRGEHAAVLQALEKPHSVRDLCRKELMPDFDVCRTLWAFRVIGLVEAMPARARAAGPSARPAPATAAPAPGRAPALVAAPVARPAPAAAAARPAPPAPAAAGPAGDAAGGQDDLLELALGEEPSDPLANSMTVSMPAAAPGPRGSGGGDEVLAGAEEEEAGLEIVAEEAEEQDGTLEIVDVEEAPPGGPAARAGARTRGGRATDASAGEPEALDEVRIDAAIASFNDRHSRLYTLLKATGGAKVTEIVRRSLATIEQDLPGLFNGLLPGADGTFDAEALKTNIFAFGVLGYAPALDMLIERELDLAGSVLGNDVRRQIAAEIKTAPV